MKVKISKVPKAEDGLQIYGEGNITPLSYNQYSNPLMYAEGPSHDNGGIPISYNGSPAEIEGDEMLYKDLNGDMQVLGNLTAPSYGKKFKNVAKDIASKEAKVSKQQDKASKLIQENDPYNSFQALSFNSGRVMQDAASQKQKALTAEKENLVNMQNAILDLAKLTGKQPQDIKFGKGGKIKARMYKDGGNLKNITTFDSYETPTFIPSSPQSYLYDAALANSIDPRIFLRQMGIESEYDPTAVSPKGALGLTQMMPATAKQYGISKEQLTSTKPEDIQAVANAGAKHFKSLLDANGNDYKLALAAYNGGQGAVDFVKKQLGKKSISGDEWVDFMNNRNQTSPTSKKHAWQNETLNYVQSIAGNNQSQGYRDKVRDQYYMPELQQLPPTPIQEIPNNSTYTPTPVNPVQPNTQKPVINNSKPKTSLADRNKLSPAEFIPDLAYIFDRPDFVYGQHYQPNLYQPYQVSFQDRLNQNNKTFRAISRNITNNPEALAALAAQKYDADNQVLSDQFRTNQGITNQVTNQNTQILNDAQLRNIQLNDEQYVRQQQAISNTKNRRFQALADVSNKIAQNRAENNNIRMAENLFNFRPDQNGNMQYVGTNPQFYNPQVGGNYQNAEITTTYDANGNQVRTVKKVLPYDEQLKAQYEAEQKRKAAQGIIKQKWGGIINKMK